MRSHSRPILARLAVPGLVAVATMLGAGSLLADTTGRTGRAQSATGCSCHGSAASAGVTVSITGPQIVAVNSSHSYTVTVSGGPASTGGGFDLKASAGTLAAGANDHVVGSEVTHSSPNNRSWTFTWTAPATTGAQSFWAIALAADLSGDETGDQWNGYGGAVNTAFPITVGAATGVGDSPALDWLAAPWPNPMRRQARIAFSIARPGPVRLELLDAAGRRVARLADGPRPSGRQEISWAARTERGEPLAAGRYFLRLSAAGIRLTRDVTVIE